MSDEKRPTRHGGVEFAGPAAGHEVDGHFPTFPFSLAHAQGKQGKGKCPRESACWADEAGFENTGYTPFWKPSGRSGKLQKGVSQILPLDQNRNM